MKSFLKITNQDFIIKNFYKNNFFQIIYKYFKYAI